MGHVRRATCYLQIAKPHLAVADLKKVIALEPKNDVVKSQLTATQKLVRRIEFEKVRNLVYVSPSMLNPF